MCASLRARPFIVQSVLNGQQRGSTIDFGRVEKTWLNSFWQLLTENCRIANLASRLASVVMIVFNYDRCIEHYVFHSIRNYYNVPERTAGELMQHLRVYHPYGMVGRLPHSPGGNTAFGASVNGQGLLNLAAGIRTFTEGTAPDSSDIDAIRTALAAAERIVFLGFGYHRLNLDLLYPLPKDDPPANRVRHVFGTAIGVSSSEVGLVDAELGTRGAVTSGKAALRNDLKCYDLFGEYWRSMSLS